jgi:hypothetical protein
MSLFANNFMKVLREEDQQSLERQAMKNVLDDGTSAEDFDIDIKKINKDVDEFSKMAADNMSSKNQEIVDELQSWIDNIQQFLLFLNSEDPNSVQSKLAAAEPDTVMDKMKQSQQTKISRVASDLAALHQNFLGFMAQTTNARYKYV